eukprot:TRINITY_DN3908_c0_g1_i3.p1 TRINITY_DN3908_c0_g1~~TRINITY_DN3908_c0_g1_i3.p1  ORF type:complete len:108 (-),score=24.39 TRINITY_DN3908_c0_g1_i3:290-613(-)
MGPKSRELIQKCVHITDDISNEALPFSTWKTVALSNVSARLARITYVGELGYEIHVPTESATAVYDHVVKIANDIWPDTGIQMGGYFAIDSLRLEKGYRAWGAEIGS